MITLNRNEDIEIFQVELTLKVKTKQSPFIPILILAKELFEEDEYYIDSEILQEKLLPVLPEKACANLLHRLFLQGYLDENWEHENEVFLIDLEAFNSKECRELCGESDFLGYELTELGEQSATDQSFWIGEKGVYNVYVSKSNIIQQRIIKIEKIERAEDDRNNTIANTPKEIRQYENQILVISKSKVLIEDIENKCFPLKPALCNLEIQAKGNETTIRITNNGQTLFTADHEIDEAVLQEELLTSCNEFEYQEDKQAILSLFNKDNLSFNRKVKIGLPIFQRITFNPIELENISHIPSDKQNAELWYSELLYKNLNQYFLDEESFNEYAVSLASPIKLHYKISIPIRKKYVEQLGEREDAFYQIAKLETIDYLNY